MTVGLWISIAFNVILLGVCGYGIYLLNKAGDAINRYDEFYAKTISVLEKHLTHMQGLMNVHVGVSGDDGVREVFMTIRKFYEMLIGYYNDAKRSTSKQ